MCTHYGVVMEDYWHKILASESTKKRLRERDTEAKREEGEKTPSPKKLEMSTPSLKKRVVCKCLGMTEADKKAHAKLIERFVDECSRCKPKATETVPTGVGTSGAAASAETVESAETEAQLTDEQLSKVDQEMKNEESAEDNTYASAAKKGKQEFPYMLFVQEGTARRIRIRKAHFTAFEDHLLKAKIQLPQEERAKIKIDWICWLQGCGLVAATDDHTAEWCKSQTAAFIYEGKTSCRAWARWETGDLYRYEGFLHGCSWKKKNSITALNLIFEMNKDKINSDKPFDYGPSIIWDTKSPRGVFCSFEPAGELALLLSDKEKWRLDAGICTWNIKCVRKKAISKEKVIERSMNSGKSDQNPETKEYS